MNFSNDPRRNGRRMRQLSQQMEFNGTAPEPPSHYLPRSPPPHEHREILPHVRGGGYTHESQQNFRQISPTLREEPEVRKFDLFGSYAPPRL